MLDLRGSIPQAWAFITDGKVHDVNIIDYLVPEPGSFYVMDRGYLDFARLYQINLSQANVVVRAKSNTRYRRQYSHPVDKSCGLKYAIRLVYSLDSMLLKIIRTNFEG